VVVLVVVRGLRDGGAVLGNRCVLCAAVRRGSCRWEKIEGTT
jgi:hypothetical protein